MSLYRCGRFSYLPCWLGMAPICLFPVHPDLHGHPVQTDHIQWVCVPGLVSRHRLLHGRVLCDLHTTLRHLQGGHFRRGHPAGGECRHTTNNRSHTLLITVASESGLCSPHDPHIFNVTLPPADQVCCEAWQELGPGLAGAPDWALCRGAMWSCGGLHSEGGGEGEAGGDQALHPGGRWPQMQQQQPALRIGPKSWGDQARWGLLHIVRARYISPADRSPPWVFIVHRI